MTLSPRAIEVGARALCIAAGDDPDKMTYAHEMACTGRDREPKYRWQYWAEFAEAAICAALAAEGLVLVPKEPTESEINTGIAAIGTDDDLSAAEIVLAVRAAMLQAAQGGNDA